MRKQYPDSNFAESDSKWTRGNRDSRHRIKLPSGSQLARRFANRQRHFAVGQNGNDSIIQIKALKVTRIGCVNYIIARLSDSICRQ